jgi:secondary thiamine-phosphate synthase enzyme
MVEEFEVTVNRRGLHEITAQVAQRVRQSGVTEGLCTLFIRHTSASLTIQENADPSCQRDLEQWLDRLVPHGDPLYTHLSEGADDMPAHLKAMLTQSSLTIPVLQGALALGVWQGIFLWEHREQSQRRRVVLHIAA